MIPDSVSISVLLYQEGHHLEYSYVEGKSQSTDDWSVISDIFLNAVLSLH